MTRRLRLLGGSVLPSTRSYLSRATSIDRGHMIQALSMWNDTGVQIKDLSPKSNHGCYFGGGVRGDPTGITLNQAGPFPGMYAVGLDGNDTGIDMVQYVVVPETMNTFGSDWNGNLYSAICWMKTGAAQWADTSTFRYGWHVRSSSDVTYYTTMGKHTTANRIFWRRRTGGVITERDYDYDPTAPIDFFCMGISFDLTGGSGGGPLIDFYLWDSISGFQKLAGSESANLTDWGNHPPTASTSVVGAGSLTQQEWIGSHSLTITWAGIKLTETQMRQAMIP